MNETRIAFNCGTREAHTTARPFLPLLHLMEYLLSVRSAGSGVSCAILGAPAFGVRQSSAALAKDRKRLSQTQSLQAIPSLKSKRQRTGALQKLALVSGALRDNLCRVAQLQFILLLCFCLSPFTLPAAHGLAGVEHVVVIGVDGLGSQGLRRAHTPHISSLRKNGASTLLAKAVMPTSSSPNWASMIMGAGPDLHGVTSNDWQPWKFERAPTCVGSGGIFPTIFGVLREQRPTAHIAVFHDWKDFGRLLETNAPNMMKHVKDAIETTETAITYLRTNKPHFLFIHFDGVDHAGHGFGWTSPQYDKALELTDSLIGGILQALDSAGMTDNTIVLVTADHGGKGTKHGGDTPEEREIPWILKGPGVRRGVALRSAVNTFDTAPTLAFIFGLKAPDCWTGKPVLEAFESSRSSAR